MYLQILNTLHFVFPAQIIILGMTFCFSTRWIGRELSAIGFLLFFLVGSYGISFFAMIFMFISIYSTGYALNILLMKRRTLESTNITYGLFAIFFPIVFFSVLSSTKITKYSYLFSQTSLAIASCTIILSFSLIFFIVKERAFLYESMRGFFSYKEKKATTQLSNIVFFIILVFLFSIINYSSFPLINYDDMGTHYPLQHRFANGFYPPFDVSLHVWAVSQWIFDLYYGLFEYFFPEQGRHFLNSILSLTIVAIIYRCLAKFSDGFNALFYAVICCTTPLFVLSLTTSQTELITTLLLVTIIFLVVNYNRQSLIMSLPVFAFSVALKPSNAVLFFIPLIAILIIEYKKYRFSVFKLSLFWKVLFCSAICAFTTYVFAYVKTGNPFFPLFNGYFKAEHFPELNFFNALYSGHFSVDAYWGLLFNTPMYLESYNYAAGFQLLLLPLFLCILPLCFKHNYELSILTLSIVIGAVALFYSQQYARYLMPCITLLPVLYFLIFSSIKRNNKLIKSFLMTFLLIVGLVNSLFIPNVIWYLKSWGNHFSLINYHGGNYNNELDAILQVNRFLNSLPGNKVVAYPMAKPYGANLDGKFIYLNWYNTAASNAVNGGEKSLMSYFQSEGVTHLIINESSSDIDINIAEKSGKIIYDAYGYQVYKLF